MTIPELHASFIRFGGLPIRYNPTFDYYIESSWHEFIKKGFTEIDLKTVLRYKLEMVKRNRWPVACLSFRNIVAHIEKFEEFLSEARAHFRCRPKETSRQEILRASGRPQHSTNNPQLSFKTPKEFLSPEKLAGYMAKLRAAAQ